MALIKDSSLKWEGNMGTKFPDIWDAKIEEKICTKENKHTRQYLHGSAIYLCPQSWKDFTILKEKIQDAVVQCNTIIILFQVGS